VFADSFSAGGFLFNQLSVSEEIPDPNPYQMVLYAILKTLHTYNTSAQVAI